MHKLLSVVVCSVFVVSGKAVQTPADALQSLLLHLSPSPARTYTGTPFRRTPSVIAKEVTEFEVGEEVEGTVETIKDYGAFLNVGTDNAGFIHISQAAEAFIDNIYEHFEEGQTVKCRVQAIDEEKNNLRLTCKSGEISDTLPVGRTVNPDATPLSDLSVGQEVEGTVKSIVGFGAFVDIGAQADALLHITQVSEDFVEDINNEFAVGETIKCWIRELDLDQSRIGLTRKASFANVKPLSDFVVGEEVTGTVKTLQDFGAFINIGAENEALLHISQADEAFVDSIYNLFQEGDTVTARIQEIDYGKGQVRLTRKTGTGTGSGPREDATPLSELVVGQEVEGTVKNTASFGVFVDIGAQADALLHISEAADDYVEDLSTMFAAGESITAKIKEIDLADQKIGLTRKTTE